TASFAGRARQLLETIDGSRERSPPAASPRADSTSPRKTVSWLSSSRDLCPYSLPSVLQVPQYWRRRISFASSSRAQARAFMRPNIATSLVGSPCAILNVPSRGLRSHFSRLAGTDGESRESARRSGAPAGAARVGARDGRQLQRGGFEPSAPPGDHLLRRHASVPGSDHAGCGTPPA